MGLGSTMTASRVTSALPRPSRLPGDRVRFRELMCSVDWPDVEREFMQFHPWARRVRTKLKALFFYLRGLSPRETRMRICFLPLSSQMPGQARRVGLCGRDGTRNCDREGFAYSIKHPDLEYARAEAMHVLSAEPWRLWLGMSIDARVLEGYSRAYIAARCLWEMTAEGFDEVTVEATRTRYLVHED